MPPGSPHFSHLSGVFSVFLRGSQPGEPQTGFPGGGRGQNREIQTVVQTGVENQAPQGELAEARGVEPGGFRNQTPNAFGQSRDFPHIA